MWHIIHSIFDSSSVHTCVETPLAPNKGSFGIPFFYFSSHFPDFNHSSNTSYSFKLKYMKIIPEYEMDLWQEEICQEFKEFSALTDDWQMPSELEKEDTDVPSYWYDDTSGLQDWE